MMVVRHVNLWENQYKYVKSKPKEFIILKGKNNTGKSEAMLHRMLNIKNNFSFEEGDRILFITKNKKSLQKMKERYFISEKSNEYLYMSLLSSKYEPEFYDLEKLVNEYGSQEKLVSSRDKVRYIKEIIKKNHLSNKKKFSSTQIFKIIEEIRYIKNSNICSVLDFPKIIEDPLHIKRKPSEIQDMMLILKEYNKILRKNKCIDDEDAIIEASKALNKLNKRYVHIFVDNAENLSGIELFMLLSIHKRKTYGTFNLCIDTNGAENTYSSLVRKGRVYSNKLFGKRKKVFNFKDEFSKLKEKEIINSYNNEEEKYKFIDLKHRTNFDFVVEYKDDTEKVKDDTNKYSEKELERIPVYSNIAAGEPILINEEIQDTFVLPSFWVKSSNNKFILKVKGNSMINAGINSGDLVLIEQNPSPFSGDIVAVNIDGSATLKRLKIKEDKILLLPENENYKPIELNRDNEFYILGKAIGIISRENNHNN